MIHYNYSHRFEPPAPLVHVTIRSQEAGREVTMVPALMDTGAHMTCIPADLVEILSLQEIRRVNVIGFDGVMTSVPTYLVDVSIREERRVSKEVVASHRETTVLLGRDVLNHYRILLDGPNLTIEIA